MPATPRRPYFSLAKDEAERSPLFGPASLVLDEDEQEVEVPPSARLLTRPEDWKGSYQDQGRLTVLPIFGAVLAAILVLGAFVYLSRDPAVPSKTVPTGVEMFEQCAATPPAPGGYFGSSDAQLEPQSRSGTCEKTLTFALDEDHGLMYQLAGVVQAYALATLNNRTFFIDDSGWDRGKWADHFEPLSDPGCDRPAWEEMKACPRSTRHWVMGSSTFGVHFSQAFAMEFEDPKAAGVHRRKLMYEMARKGFMDILVPSMENEWLIKMARKSLDDQYGDPRPYLGVHLRGGDRHAMEWRFRNSYVPVEQFATAIEDQWLDLRAQNSSLPADPTVWVATDDPPRLRDLISSAPRSVAFLSLSSSTSPALRRVAPIGPYTQDTWLVTPRDEREGATRAAITDFALLTGGWGGHGIASVLHSQQPEKVICTISSNVCRLAAVAMGWERAFEEKRWLNLDGTNDFDWRPTEVL